MDETSSRLPEVQAMPNGTGHIESRFSHHLKGVGDVGILAMFQHLLGNETHGDTK